MIACGGKHLFLNFFLYFTAWALFKPHPLRFLGGFIRDILKLVQVLEKLSCCHV
jgi:hypothetical protein